MGQGKIEGEPSIPVHEHGLREAASDTNERLPRHEAVYRALREMIATGRLTPGEAVTIQSIADRFSVSMTPVREALRRLVAEGALELLGNRRVRLPEIDRERMAEMALARRALEPILAEMAAMRARPALVERLKRLDAEVNAAIARGDVPAYMRANHAFHFTIYGAAGSSVLLPIVDGLWLRFAPLYRIVAGKQGTDSLIDQHEAAISALASGDVPAARRAIRADIDQGIQLVCSAFGWGGV